MHNIDNQKPLDECKVVFFSKVIQKVCLDRREDEVLLIKYIAVATQSFQ